MGKTQFLTYLIREFNQYNLIPDTDSQAQREKKEYINGLMKAARFFGVSFDELQVIINGNNKEQMYDLSIFGNSETIDIPTFIRENKTIKIN